MLPQEVLELQKPGSWESTAGDFQHIHIIISNTLHMVSTTEYCCKCNLGLNHLCDSVWLFSLMKAMLAAEGRPLSDHEFNGSSPPDIWHNENQIIILLLLGTVDI